MTILRSVRVRLVATVFLAMAPAWVLMYFFAFDPPWMRFALGLLALGSAWYGGERFILRQVRILTRAAEQLTLENYASRSGLCAEQTELGDLARVFDRLAERLEQRKREREAAEKTLLNRSFQQTVVSALGQFALVSNDFAALLNQAVMLAAQTLEVEYAYILELQPDGQNLVFKAGVGWKPEVMAKMRISTLTDPQMGYTLKAGEPVVVDELARETRFRASRWLLEQGITSGMTVAISGHGRAYGVLGVHTPHRRAFSEDEVHFLLAIGTVLAMGVERSLAEAQLQKLAAFAQLNPNPAMELTLTGSLTYFNSAALKLASTIGRSSPRGILPSEIQNITQACLLTKKSKLNYETRVEGRTLSWSFHPVPSSQVVHAYVDDITDRLSLEAQLRQSQKMESVGQLAAGVAHDFNNMLTVIQGHSGMLMAKATLQPELKDSARAIFAAAERAAGLTRQLLMFSRKNVMQPKLLDLREVVTQMSKMLQRLLGETVELRFQPPHDLPLIEADTGMIEQVLMNFAVNSRDAMPKGGTLTITTDAVEVDEAYAQKHPESRPGSFVCLEVTDTGCGMDPATIARIFEPFFTTKEVGKGTGLGLATVYGIVKQHNGWIEVISEVRRGASFRVFFPASHKKAEPRTIDGGGAIEVRGGKETILIVEDEPVLRDMAHVILEDCGYRILEASSGREALLVWDQHKSEVDLVLTDMPEGISGMELAQRLIIENPALRIIFASGYSMDDLDTEFMRETRATFLQKPYTHITLAKAVRESLDNRGAPPLEEPKI
jgi:signal transduction histidine kinase/CheY-like chemotaxis protein